MSWGSLQQRCVDKKADKPRPDSNRVYTGPVSTVISSRSSLESRDKRVPAVLWSCTVQGTTRLDEKTCFWKNPEIPLGLLGSRCSWEWTTDRVRKDNRKVLPERRFRDKKNNRQAVALWEQNSSLIKRNCFSQGRNPTTGNILPAGPLWGHTYCDSVFFLPNESVD